MAWPSGLALRLPLLSWAATIAATADATKVDLGRPHQSWKLSGNPVSDRPFD
eukprot:COSAG02_NODE_36153_length_458_cov_0.927577_1_plen_51_part_01